MKYEDLIPHINELEAFIFDSLNLNGINMKLTIYVSERMCIAISNSALHNMFEIMFGVNYIIDFDRKDGEFGLTNKSDLEDVLQLVRE